MFLATADVVKMTYMRSPMIDMKSSMMKSISVMMTEADEPQPHTDDDENDCE